MPVNRRVVGGVVERFALRGPECLAWSKEVTSHSVV